MPSDMERRDWLGVEAMITGGLGEAVKVMLASSLGLNPVLIAALVGPLPLWVQGLPEGLQRLLFRGVERQRALTDEATSWSGIDLDELITRAMADEHRVELLARALEGAQHSADERQARALGRVLADGMRDDAVVDESRKVVSTLSRLDPSDVRVLALMGDGRPWKKRRPEKNGQGSSVVSELLPTLSPVIDAIFAVLTTQGVISDEATGLSAVGTSWSITEFGRLCLRWLEADSANARA